MRLEDSPLNQNYAVALLLYLKREGESSISGLTPDVCKNYRTVRDLVDELKEAGFVKINKQYSPVRKFTVDLTKKGRKTAQKLLEIEEIMEE